MKRQYALLLVLAPLLAACDYFAKEAERPPLLEVEKHVLYQDEMAAIVPADASAADSAALADAFIRRWVTNVLLYEHAKRNVPNEAEIDQMVEEYRKSLTIHYYQQMLVAQRLPENSEEEITAFYEAHSDQFTLSENLLKGVLVKVPIGAPRIDKLRRVFRKLDDTNVQELEDYCVKHAASYDYFVDSWVYFNDILKKMPAPAMSPAAFLANTPLYETADSTYIYMLSIADYKLAGSTAPIEFVHDKISNLLDDRHKLEYIKQIEASLYDDAVANGQVKFYVTHENDGQFETENNE